MSNRPQKEPKIRYKDPPHKPKPRADRPASTPTQKFFSHFVLFGVHEKFRVILLRIMQRDTEWRQKVLRKRERFRTLSEDISMLGEKKQKTMLRIKIINKFGHGRYYRKET
jgi:hypothetical protein